MTFAACTRLILATVLVAAGSTALAQSKGYGYPYAEWYVATINAALLKGESAEETGEDTGLRYLTVHPERLGNPYIKGRQQLVYRLHGQEQRAPLVFVIGGLGASTFSGVSRYVADLLHQDGFHVVVLPSPFNWNFTFAASRSGLPGVTAEDAEDLYRVMTRILQVARFEEGLDITRIGAVGVSLGGLELAYVSRLDRERREVGIDRYLLINPPVDLDYAIERIDAFRSIARDWAPEKVERLIAYGVNTVLEAQQRPIDTPGYFEDLGERLELEPHEMKFLIGQAMHEPLTEVIFVADILHQGRILTAPFDENELTLRRAQAAELGFRDYFERVLLPMWAARRDVDEPRRALLERTNLTPLLDELAADPGVFVMHNADDFVVKPSDLQALQATLRERLHLFPSGGHLGNLWYPANSAAIQETFAPLLDSRPRSVAASADAAPLVPRKL